MSVKVPPISTATLNLLSEFIATMRVPLPD